MNYKFKKLLVIILFCFSVNVSAKNIDVVTSISVSLMNMDLNLKENIPHSGGGTSTRDKNIKPELQGTEISVSIIDDKNYYGFSTKVMGQTVANYTDNIDGTITPSSEVNSRSSFNIFTGYSFANNLSVYGGYTKGTSSYGDKVNFSENGPFLGGRYALRLSPSSSFTFDMSYTILETGLVIKDDVYTNGNGDDGHNLTTSSTGLSASLTWVKSLDRGRSFFVRLKLNDFAIKEKSIAVVDTTNSRTGTATVNGSQKLVGLNFGMAF